MTLALCNRPRVAWGHQDQAWIRHGAATLPFRYGKGPPCSRRRGSRLAILGWLLRTGLALLHRRRSSCRHHHRMHPQSIAHKAQCRHRRPAGPVVASAWAPRVEMLGIPHPCSSSSSSSIVGEWFLEGRESCLGVVVAGRRCKSRHLAAALGGTGPGSCNCSSARAAATTSTVKQPWATTAVACSCTTSLEVEASDAEIAAGAVETFQVCLAPPIFMAVTAVWQWMLRQCHL